MTVGYVQDFRMKLTIYISVLLLLLIFALCWTNRLCMSIHYRGKRTMTNHVVKHIINDIKFSTHLVKIYIYLSNCGVLNDHRLIGSSFRQTTTGEISDILKHKGSIFCYISWECHLISWRVLVSMQLGDLSFAKIIELIKNDMKIQTVDHSMYQRQCCAELSMDFYGDNWVVIAIFLPVLDYSNLI